jgi:hypothetical protein
MHHAAATTISFNPPSVFLPVGIKFREANWIASHRAECRNTTELQLDICFFNLFGNIVCDFIGYVTCNGEYEHDLKFALDREVKKSLLYCLVIKLNKNQLDAHPF